MLFDIIGDIHGHADALKTLLSNMGYRKSQGAWRHPDRQAIFVGDFIDRGPNQLETVDLVRRMVDVGSAQAILGNHELNAIAWYLPDPELPGDYLRSHFSPKYGEKNYRQHAAFLNEITEPSLHKNLIDWFLTLPLWLDLDNIRVVHACWHSSYMDFLKPLLAEGNRLTEDLMIEATREPSEVSEKDNPEPSVFKAVEALTKGIEIPLPQPHIFQDKDGLQRNRVRIRWWDKNATTFRQSAMLSESENQTLPELPIPEHVRLGYEEDKPLFVGHYWLDGNPETLSDRVACVDYSVAKGGKLVAYRWQGESVLTKHNFHYDGE